MGSPDRLDRERRGEREQTFQQVHSAGWLAHFVRAGHPAARPLAAGVEGAVYDLGDGTVAKVWGHRRPAELRPWQEFYADLAAAGLLFGTPEILRVDDVDGVAVTVERLLPGRPLQVDPEAAEIPARSRRPWSTCCARWRPCRRPRPCGGCPCWTRPAPSVPPGTTSRAP